MKTKTIKIPVEWVERGYYEYSFPADMPEEEARKKAIELAGIDALPDGDYLTDSFLVDEEGITIEEGNEREEGDICEENHIYGVSFYANFNRKLKENELPSPGSYTCIIGEKEYSFDFTRACSSSTDKTWYYEATRLDTEAFPDSKNITFNMIKEAIFEEIYIDLEGCEADLEILGIENFRVHFTDGSQVAVSDNEIRHLFEERLSFYKCVQLLDRCIKGNILKRDPNCKDNILVYYRADGINPEGWYSANLMSTAQEVAEDIFAQRYLLGECERRGISTEFEELAM